MDGSNNAAQAATMGAHEIAQAIVHGGQKNAAILAALRAQYEPEFIALVVQHVVTMRNAQSGNDDAVKHVGQLVRRAGDAETGLVYTVSFKQRKNPLSKAKVLTFAVELYEKPDGPSELEKLGADLCAVASRLCDVKDEDMRADAVAMRHTMTTVLRMLAEHNAPTKLREKVRDTVDALEQLEQEMAEAEAEASE